MDQSFLDRRLSRLVGRKHVKGAVLYVSSGDGSMDLISAAGNCEPGSRYYIASINKIFMSALILRLAAQGKLSLEDPLAEYVSDEVIEGLHRLEGKDYSGEIKLIHLISQTSGLPDYIADRQENGEILIDELVKGKDQEWPLERVVSTVKKMKPHFPPGTPGKARYIDTNHQILMKVVENAAGTPAEQALTDLFAELGMTDTFAGASIAGKNYVPVRYKDTEPEISKFITSTGNDIISTARDQMKFLKAFFDGYFYPKDRLAELEQWNPIFSPFYYGTGIQKFSLSPLMNRIFGFFPLIGHCGSTGSVAFYVREKDLYFTGTVNQQSAPGTLYKLMLQITKNYSGRL